MQRSRSEPAFQSRRPAPACRSRRDGNRTNGPMPAAGICQTHAAHSVRHTVRTVQTAELGSGPIPHLHMSHSPCYTTPVPVPQFHLSSTAVANDQRCARHGHRERVDAPGRARERRRRLQAVGCIGDLEMIHMFRVPCGVFGVGVGVSSWYQCRSQDSPAKMVQTSRAWHTDLACSCSPSAHERHTCPPIDRKGLGNLGERADATRPDRARSGGRWRIRFETRVLARRPSTAASHDGSSDMGCCRFDLNSTEHER